jgi:uncharacterized caspase-like protein
MARWLALRGCGAFLLAITVLWGMLGPAHADKRVALVIGNGAYQNVPALPNPPHDAADIAASLQRLGFSVRMLKDGRFDDMRRALLSFARDARHSDMAIVYFAGHGMEIGGENWLIPVDAELKTDLDIEQEAIGLKGVTLMVSAASKLGLVILDSCRNNPFQARMQRTVRTRAVSRGLARIEPAGSVLVAYAAKDGTTADDGTGGHSPYSAALLKYLEQPGLEINFLFRNVRDEVLHDTDHHQEPFLYGSLSKEAIYLRPPLPPKPQVAVPPPPPGPGPDEITWNFLKGTNDSAALQRFIAEFPKSPLRGQAEARVASLAALPKAEPVPAGPSPEEIAWKLVRDTSDRDQLHRFLEQFPQTKRRGEAEKRIASLDATAAKQAETERLAERHELARSLQLELKRVGCFEGSVDGEYGSVTRTALSNFAKLAALNLPEDEPSADALQAVRRFDKRICPLVCPRGEHADGDRCIRIVCPAGQLLKDGTCAPEAGTERKRKITSNPERRIRPAARERGGGGGRCFSFEGRRFCE